VDLYMSMYVFRRLFDARLPGLIIFWLNSDIEHPLHELLIKDYT
jgi:hypothetical protein